MVRPQERRRLSNPPFYREEFEEAFRFVLEEYPLPRRALALFVPCAVRKPYSASPSHRIFRAVLDRVLAPDEYQLLVFGTCGVVPAELEEMYPFAHYRFMLGAVRDSRVRRDFLEIETDRLARFLSATRGLYRARGAYCIGLFREAMERGAGRAGVPLDLLLPSAETIARVSDPGSPFPAGSLACREYTAELEEGLERLAVRVRRGRG
ncbi:MAG: DUF5591 domain-containing protein [Methanospirillum sp.]|nr:DUF5591 domain-containing protein [Methanospirillum sp.]